MESYRWLEDLVVYQKLCQLHIAISELTVGKQLPELDRRWSQSLMREVSEDYCTSPPRFPEP